MLIITGENTPIIYIGVLIIPTTPSPYTPTSTSIYYHPELNKKVRGAFITSETSIKLVLFHES
jgi:hypothetical protein